MDELYLTVNTDDGAVLCLSPLTDRQIEKASSPIDDPSGYFLFERRGRGDLETIEVLAHIQSDEAVERLRQMLSLS